jgi:hypothetical protein
MPQPRRERAGGPVSSRSYPRQIRTTREEADALELPADGPVTRVSRVLLPDGEAAAWMIDVLCLVRDTPASRDPAIVLQLLADT